MIRSFVYASILFVSNGALGRNEAPFRVISQDIDSKNETVLFKQGGFRVVKSPGSNAQDFEKLYWVNIEGAQQQIDAGAFGEVLHEQNELFYIVRVNSDPEVARLSALLHRIGQPCGALVQITGSALVDELTIADPQPLVSVKTRLSDVAAMISTVSPARIRATVEEISSIHTRYHTSATGKTVADILAGMYRSHAQGRDDIEISTFEHGSATPQLSLVVRIRGSMIPDEIVVLGSHLDSINYQSPGSAVAPGSDDNASGTATNLEIFRVMMEEGFRPRRTVEIHAYAAEEVGLNGSQDMASKYKAANKKVISMVQHDMNLYSSNGQTKIYLVSNNTNASLNSSLSQLIDAYLSVPWETKNLSGGNSDHYSWTRNGFAAAFPFENPSDYNRHIHTANDDIAHSGLFDQAAAFARLGLTYIAHFAGN